MMLWLMLACYELACGVVLALEGVNVRLVHPSCTAPIYPSPRRGPHADGATVRYNSTYRTVGPYFTVYRHTLATRDHDRLTLT